MSPERLAEIAGPFLPRGAVKRKFRGKRPLLIRPSPFEKAVFRCAGFCGAKFAARLYGFEALRGFFVATIRLQPQGYRKCIGVILDGNRGIKFAESRPRKVAILQGMCVVDLVVAHSQVQIEES